MATHLRLVFLVFLLAPGLVSCELGTFSHHTAGLADGGQGIPDGCVPFPEVCDGKDNSCNGLVDDDDPFVIVDDVHNCGQCGHVCDLPNVELHTCVDRKCGIAKCDPGYSDLNETASDGCESDCVKTLDWDPCDGIDNDCNGIVDDGFDLENDPNNCGACNFRCEEEYPESEYHVLSFTCQNGQCKVAACAQDYYDLDGLLDDGAGNLGCEYHCQVRYTVELCNGQDDDCDGVVDNNPVDAPGCLSQGVCAGTQPVCDSATGTWLCPYPATYQLIEDESLGCDGLDNDCDGRADEAFGVGQSCSVGQGACRRTGVYQCNAAGTDSECDAVPGPASQEVCDGIDNDCDGLVDEDRWEDSNNNYVRPQVVAIGGGKYMFAYEASRPNATASSAGTGNGYHCASGCGAGIPNAPTGVPLEGTRACSVQGRLPWFNVSPIEAEQTCQAVGGRVCTSAEWQSACQAGQSCTWAYATLCTTPANYTTRFCNLGGYDFDPGIAGDQDGLLVTGSPLLGNCWAAHSGGYLYDMTGNLREITKSGTNTYPLRGGAFNTVSESGGRCTFNFYVVEADFRLWDTGFRCCFDANPSP